MKHSRQIRRIARDQTERAFLVERLETIEQLPGDLKIDIDAETDPDQLIDFARSPNREHAWTDLGEREIRFLPNRQPAQVSPMKFIVGSDSTDDLRSVAAVFNQDKFAN